MQDVFQQVMITCTTINSIIFFGFVMEWIIRKIEKYQRQKKETQQQKVDKN